MTDSLRKRDTIRAIKDLQLSDDLVIALNDAQRAEGIATAVGFLQALAKQWH